MRELMDIDEILRTDNNDPTPTLQPHDSTRTRHNMRDAWTQLDSTFAAQSNSAETQSKGSQTTVTAQTILHNMVKIDPNNNVM